MHVFPAFLGSSITDAPAIGKVARHAKGEIGGGPNLNRGESLRLCGASDIDRVARYQYDEMIDVAPFEDRRSGRGTRRRPTLAEWSRL